MKIEPRTFTLPSGEVLTVRSLCADDAEALNAFRYATYSETYFMCRSVRRGGCGGRRPESETCKIRSDMRKTNVMQILRLVMMIAAVAGVIYALEYMERGIAVWFWITLLGVGFVGLLYTFRLTQRRLRLERRAKERQEKKKSRKQKR